MIRSTWIQLHQDPYNEPNALTALQPRGLILQEALLWVAVGARQLGELPWVRCWSPLCSIVVWLFYALCISTKSCAFSVSVWRSAPCNEIYSRLIKEVQVFCVFDKKSNARPDSYNELNALFIFLKKKHSDQTSLKRKKVAFHLISCLLQILWSLTHVKFKGTVGI